MATEKCAKCGSPFEQISNGRRKYCELHASRTRNPKNKPKAPLMEEGSVSIALAATLGRRELLVALRNSIATQIDRGVPARDLASLSKRLVDISDELDGLIKQQEGDDIGKATHTPDEEWTPAGGVQISTA